MCIRDSTYTDRIDKDEPESSLYERLFFDAINVNSQNAFILALPVGDGLTTPASLAVEPSTDELLSTYGSELVGAFKTTMEELEVAQEQVVAERSLATGTKLQLSLENIWLMFRRIHLTQTAGLSVEEMQWFSDSIGINPLTSSGSIPSPQDSLVWFERLHSFQEMGFSVQHLAWLLADDKGARQRVGPSDLEVQTQLGRLRDILRGVEQTSQHPALVLQQLAVDFNLPTEMIELLNTIQYTQVNSNSNSLTEILSDSDFIHNNSDARDTDESWSDLVFDSSEPAVVRAVQTYGLLWRISFIVSSLRIDVEGMKLLVHYQSELDLIDFSLLPVTESIGNILQLTTQMWNTVRVSSLDDVLVGETPVAYSLLQVAQQGDESMVYEQFSLRTSRPVEDIRILFEHFFGTISTKVTTTSFDTMQTIYSLSVEDVTLSAVKAAGEWIDAEEMWVSLRGAIEADSETIARVSVTYIDAQGEVTSPGSQPVAGLLLSPLNGYQANISSTSLDVLWDIYDVELLTRLVDALSYLARLPISASEFLTWNHVDPNSTISESVRSAVRSKYDTPEAWMKIGKPIQDKLRLAKRNALMAWLMGNNNDLNNVADVHSFYLVDPAMSPCMKTTRLKLAISSVQLFIFRALSGLETYTVNEDFQEVLLLNQEIAEAWSWRKSYRVWEAARKVFLYPENWIEPELRQDKTTFFEDFESEVLQNEITEEFVESAFKNYLEQVHRISNLLIIGLYHDYQKGERDVLHIFGQTRSIPTQTWYRKREEGMWTPWEAVELNLPAPQVAPVLFFNRLMYFWMAARQTMLQDRDSD